MFFFLSSEYLFSFHCARCFLRHRLFVFWCHLSRYVRKGNTFDEKKNANQTEKDNWKKCKEGSQQTVTKAKSSGKQEKNNEIIVFTFREREKKTVVNILVAEWARPCYGISNSLVDAFVSIVLCVCFAPFFCCLWKCSKIKPKCNNNNDCVTNEIKTLIFFVCSLSERMNGKKMLQKMRDGALFSWQRGIDFVSLCEQWDHRAKHRIHSFHLVALLRSNFEGTMCTAQL